MGGLRNPLWPSLHTKKSGQNHSLATIVSQDKSKRGAEGKCIYIDTEGSFRPERISGIAKARGFDSDLALENITLSQPQNSEEQELVVERFILNDLARSGEKRAKLIVVDSPITHYKTEYTGLSEQSSKLQKLYWFMSNLRRIGQSYGVAIVVTNHASTIPDSNLVADIDIKKPAGGNAIGYASTYSLYLKIRSRTRRNAVLDSEAGSTSFLFESNGFSYP
jgi:RecA/RadA recombinase